MCAFPEHEPPARGAAPAGRRAPAELPGGQGGREPPDPIPTSEVKPPRADDSVDPHAKVGHRQAPNPRPPATKAGGLLFCRQDAHGPRRCQARRGAGPVQDLGGKSGLWRQRLLALADDLATRCVLLDFIRCRCVGCAKLWLKLRDFWPRSNLAIPGTRISAIPAGMTIF